MTWLPVPPEPRPPRIGRRLVPDWRCPAAPRRDARAPPTAARTSPPATPASSSASPPTAAPAATAPTPRRARCSSPSRTRRSLCLSCHGAAGTGATTDVETGVQYTLGAGGSARRGPGRRPALRRLRPGPDRLREHAADLVPEAVRPGVTTWFSSHVRVLATAGQPGHLGPPRPRAARPSSRRGMAWGNGGAQRGRRPAFTTELHDLPQPARQRRLPDPQPDPGRRDRLPRRGRPVNVTDAALPTGTGATGTRNYTILWGRTLADVINAHLPGRRHRHHRRRLLAATTSPGTGSRPDRRRPPGPVPAAASTATGRCTSPAASQPHRRSAARSPRGAAPATRATTRITGATVDTGDAIYTLPPRRGPDASAPSATSPTAPTPRCPACSRPWLPYPDAAGGATPDHERLQPPAQDRQPRHLPGLPRPDAHHPVPRNVVQDPAN